MATDVDELVTVREVARLCRRTTETVRRWIWEGKLPAQKLGNQLFVRRANLVRMLAEHRERDRAARLAALDRARDVRERIRRHIGGTIDILELLDESRESHP